MVNLAVHKPPASARYQRPPTPSTTQAKITQQANLAAGKRAPPVWAMFAIMLLGWNEFVAVLWNPIYLILGFLSFMFGWMLYSELDVDARMQQGWVSGLLGIWTNLGDALRTVRTRGALGGVFGASPRPRVRYNTPWATCRTVSTTTIAKCAGVRAHGPHERGAAR